MKRIQNITENTKTMADRLWLFPVAFIILVGIIVYPFFFPQDTCKETAVKLYWQKVENLTGSCDNCLIFNVSELVCGQPGGGCGCEYEDKILYFKDESEIRNDLANDSNIWVNWCWIKRLHSYRIRGVRAYE